MINLGVLKGSGTLLYNLKIGSNCLSVSKAGRQLYVQINNRTILAAQTEKYFNNRTAPVTIMLANNMAENCKSKPESQISKKHVNVLETILKGIRENLKPVETFALKLKPDEITENRPSDIVKGFDTYKKAHEKFAETLDSLYQKSMDMLNTRLSKEVWGGKNISGGLNSVKSEVSELSNSMETVLGALEKCSSNVDMVHDCMDHKLIMQSKMAIEKLVHNFSLIKSFMSAMAQTLYPLYDMDKTCHKYAGFPATFFFSSSSYLDVRYDYENSIQHLIASVELESSVIEPLLAKKIAGV